MNNNNYFTSILKQEATVVALQIVVPAQIVVGDNLSVTNFEAETEILRKEFEAETGIYQKLSRPRPMPLVKLCPRGRDHWL